ncbi:MAG: MipA/OmpV family protein [Alphaproteobacteria bacterium]
MPVPLRLILTAAAFWLGVAASAQAQSRADSWDWRVKLGAGAMVAPDYEGSDEYDIRPIPDIEINYRDALVLKNTALSYDAMKAISPGSAWRLGPRARYVFGRDQDDNAALRGLGDVDGSVELGGFLGYGVGPWSAELSVLQDVADGHGGMIAQLEGGYSFRFTPRLGGRLSASTSYGDDSYMQSFFGVTAAQAARSGYAVQNADAGFKDAGLALGMSYGLTENWALGGFVGYKRLLGDGADAQIVDNAGSADQIRTGLTLSYSF